MKAYAPDDLLNELEARKAEVISLRAEIDYWRRAFSHLSEATKQNVKRMDKVLGEMESKCRAS